MPLGFTGDNPDMCLHIWLAGQRTKCWYTLWVIPCTHGRSFSAHWVDRALTRVHWRCVTWCRACSDVKPLKPQSNDDKQMEHVERTAKICSSLNRISCCLFLEKWNHIKLEIFFFPLSRLLTLEKDALVIPSILILYRRCHFFFSQQKTGWVFSCSPLPSVKNPAMELEMPTGNTQCCWTLLVLTWLVVRFAGWKTGLKGSESKALQAPGS